MKHVPNQDPPNSDELKTAINRTPELRLGRERATLQLILGSALYGKPHPGGQLAEIQLFGIVRHVFAAGNA